MSFFKFPKWNFPREFSAQEAKIFQRKVKIQQKKRNFSKNFSPQKGVKLPKNLRKKGENFAPKNENLQKKEASFA